MVQHSLTKRFESTSKMLEERRERDHRKIGKDLELFTNNQLVGAGLPLWLPNGATIRREIERYIVDKEVSMGYDHVYTPVLANVDLYKTSGHWDHYQEDMFPAMKLDEDEAMVLRPMNCPHHMMIYKTNLILIANYLYVLLNWVLCIVTKVQYQVYNVFEE